MGKWTPDYVDDVLHWKIKNLVSGAINRSSMEKTEPTISYENFVKELDTGDSFTTSIIEILVKELAERRTRPTLNDRKFIADRSAKSLQLLARLRVYRGPMARTHPSRRTDYLSIPPVEMDMEEDEDIFESMLDNEGIRVNSDLYEAYGAHASVASRPSPPADEPASPILTHPPPVRNAPWSTSSNFPISTNTLTRQPSIRRPIRSRTVDFNDFTHRRRTSTRENQISRGEPSEPAEHRDSSWNRGSQSTRRFFPFTRTRRHESTDSYPWASEGNPPQGADTDEDRITYASAGSFSAPWFNLTPPMPREPTTMEEVLADAALSDERAQIATPRLRRGGLRAPESVLSRHASPVSAHPSESTLDGLLSQLRDPNLVGETSAYPTPSTDHEFLS